jgi:mRNA-degrading endonuclease RelE of RelBE toxin-antitoxin system
MKIYYTPEFARQVEGATTRHQNMVKLIAKFFETHELPEIRDHPRISPRKIKEPDLYRIKLEELRILASLKADTSGLFWIFSQLEERG